MKKFIFYFCLCWGVITIVGCNKDDDFDKTWNQQDKTRWKNKTETFSSRLNASYQFDDNNSLGASFSFLRNPKLIIDGETEGSVLRRPHKGGHVFCVRHLQS